MLRVSKANALPAESRFFFQGCLAEELESRTPRFAPASNGLDPKSKLTQSHMTVSASPCNTENGSLGISAG